MPLAAIWARVEAGLLHFHHGQLVAADDLGHLAQACLQGVDQGVEGADGLADLVVPGHRHPAREVQADGDVGHGLFHVLEGMGDLAVEAEAETAQDEHGQAGGNRQDGDGFPQAGFHGGQGGLLGTALFHPQGFQDLFQFLQVGPGAAGQGGVGQFLLALEAQGGDLVEGFVIVAEAFLGLVHQAVFGL